MGDKKECYIKKLLSLLLSIAMVFATLSLDGIESRAAGNIVICGVDIGIQAGVKMEFNGNSYGGRDLGATECFGFARWCQYKIFGIDSYNESSSFDKVSVNGSTSIAVGSLNTTNLKAMITASKPGAHLRTYKTSSNSAHSMVITDITDSGFSIADCNGTGVSNVTDTRTYTWSQYVSSTFGARGINYIELPKEYVLVNGGTSNTTTSYTVDSNYSSFTPFYAYPIETGNISVYSAPEGSVKSNRYITGSTDLCEIKEVYTNGWCKVTYPSSISSTGYADAYTQLSVFISSASLSKWTANAEYDAYRRSSGSDKIGTVSKGDSCLKVSTGNGRTQVIYPVTGKGYYKMGWIGAASSTSTSSGGTSNATVSNSYKTPCDTYAISTGRISVYDKNGVVESNRFIDGASDLCTIQEIYTNGWCKVKYPSSSSSSGYREAYTPLSEFISNASPSAWTATTEYNAYRRSSGSDRIGTVSSGDQCIKVSEANGRMQVMYPVTGTNYYKMGWIDMTGGNDPKYAIDQCSGGLYMLYVAGWAFDDDDTGAQLGIEVYIGSTKIGSMTANGSRTDVNNVYGCGSNHGFSGTFSVPSDLTGTQTVTIKIANVGSGNAKTITQSVTIKSDTTGPTISSVNVTDKTVNGYTVTCTVTDENGVDRVQFPTWTTANGQDDIFSDWDTNTAASGTASGSTYTYHVYVSAHKYETGEYNTHIYAYDKYGNSTRVEAPKVDVPSPVTSIDLNRTNITLNNIGESTTLTATIKPDNAADKTVKWTTSNSKVATVSNGKVVAVGKGTAVITATSSNRLTADCTVTVNRPAVAIVSEPNDIEVEVGTDVSLSVEATGYGLTYQWQYKIEGANWTNWTNYTSATMSTKATKDWDGIKIRCKVTDEDGNTATTREVACSIVNSLVITTQPEDITTTAGSSVTLTVGATGDGLTYQWQYKKVGGSWTSWKNYKSSTVTTKSTSAWDGMKIRCVITDSKGNTVNSREVLVSLETIIPITITSEPQDITTSVGEKVTLTVGATGDGLTYQWQYKKVGGNWTSWSSYKAASMTTKATSAWDGMKIRCVITDSKGKTATTREVQSSFIKETPIVITNEPQDITTSVGENVTLTVGATGDGLTYQWQYKRVGGSWTSWKNYKAASMTTKATSAWDGMKIRCVITDSKGKTATTREVQSSFIKETPIVITSEPQDIITSVGENVTLTVGATGDGLTYQWQYKRVGGDWTSWKNYKAASMTTKATSAWDGMKIRCIITDANGKTATTREVLSSFQISVNKSVSIIDLYEGYETLVEEAVTDVPEEEETVTDIPDEEETTVEEGNTDTTEETVTDTPDEEETTVEEGNTDTTEETVTDTPEEEEVSVEEETVDILE